MRRPTSPALSAAPRRRRARLRRKPEAGNQKADARTAEFGFQGAFRLNAGLDRPNSMAGASHPISGFRFLISDF